MADLADVTSALADIATAACYPNGTGALSVTGRDISIFEGWPERGAVDAAVNASPPTALVSVMPIAGASQTSDQFWEEPQVIVAPVHGFTVAVNDTQVTISGNPSPGEYLTLVVDGKAYSRSGEDVLSGALVADVQADYPLATVSNSTITIPGSHSIEARLGAVAGLGQLLHRQRQLISVNVWAPSPQDRSLIAAAVDVALKRNWRLRLPDTSQALINFERTATIDEEQNAGIYRRDLVWSVDYATVDLMDAYEVTSTALTIELKPAGPGQELAP